MIEYGFYDRADPREGAERQAVEQRERIQAEAQKKRDVLVRAFHTAEGRAALEVMREMAELRAVRPLDIPETGRANRVIWWREGRRDLVGEIEAVIKTEAKR